MQLEDGGEMKVLHDSDAIVLVASYLEPTYKELEPPYLSICALKSNELVKGY